MLQQREREAFELYGSWREYGPIAFTNLLLTIGTLGLDQRTQSTTRAPRQGEGLFDSLDMGAF